MLLGGSAGVYISSTQDIHSSVRSGSLRSSSHTTILSSGSALVTSDATILLRSRGRAAASPDALVLRGGRLTLSTTRTLIMQSDNRVRLFASELSLASCELPDTNLAQFGSYNCAAAVNYVREVGADCYTDLAGFTAFGVGGLLASHCPHACGVCGVLLVGSSLAVDTDDVSIHAADQIQVRGGTTASIETVTPSSQVWWRAEQVVATGGPTGMELAAAQHFSLIGSRQTIDGVRLFVASALSGHVELDATTTTVAAQDVAVASDGSAAVIAQQGFLLHGDASLVTANFDIQLSLIHI